MHRLVGPHDRNGVRHTLLICDLFCGAGGFTTGALRAIRELGLEAVMAAVNHWPVAIATHRLNHPEVRHYIEDVKAANPVDIVPERYLDVLLCSPSCVFFSRARGGRPNSDQKRMDPEAIIRWIDEIDVRILICENVPEFRKWCRVDPETERPMRGCEGEFYDDWIRRIEARGYKVEWRILNCADYGDPTSRQRWFMIARKDGVPIEWPRQSHSKTGGVDAQGQPIAKWRGASEIIDWRDRGTSIFNRRPRRKGYRALKGALKQLRALAFNTLRRVKAGTDRFTGLWRRAFAAAIEEEMELVLLDEAGLDRPSSRRLLTFRWDAEEGAVPVDPNEARVVFQPGEILDPAAPYTLLADASAVALDPWLVMLYGTGKVRPLGSPAPTATAGGKNACLTQPTVQLRGAVPFTCANRTRNAPRSVADPVAPVLTGSGGSLWIANPGVDAYMLSQQSGGAPRAARLPVPAVATAGAISLAVPRVDGLSSYLVAVNHGDGPSGNYARRIRDLADPLQGNTATRGFALLAPVVTAHQQELQAYTAAFFGSNVGRRSATSPLTIPLRAVTTHGRYGFCLPTMTPYLVPQFGERAGQAPRIHLIDVPAPAVTSHGAGALVVPMLVRIDNAGSGGAGVRAAWEPVWTHTGKVGCGIAESYIISPRHSRLGGGPVPRHVGMPVPTLTAGGSQLGVVNARAGRSQLSLLPQPDDRAREAELDLDVTRRTVAPPPPRGRSIWVDGVLAQIDVAFRMLRNRELARSHSFDDEETTYEFVGTEAEQTRQVGNSVPVSTARALVFSQICRIPGVFSIESAMAAKAKPKPIADQLPAAA